MADEPNSSKPGEMPNPAAVSETHTEANPTNPQPTAAELAAQLATLQKALKDANRESAERRKKLEAIESAEAERKQAEMSETDKLKAKVEQAEKDKAEALAKANQRIIRAEILAKAAGKFIDPADVVTALESRLTVNDNGDVEGLDEAIKELEKNKPHWVKRAGTNLGPTNPGGNAGNGETLEQRRNRVYNQQGGGIFDPGAARQKGGGVIFTEPK